MNLWEPDKSPIARTNSRDRRTLLLLIGYCALGLAVLAIVVGLGPLLPTIVMTWRAGR